MHRVESVLFWETWEKIISTATRIGSTSFWQNWIENLTNLFLKIYFDWLILAENPKVAALRILLAANWVFRVCLIIVRPPPNVNGSTTRKDAERYTYIRIWLYTLFFMRIILIGITNLIKSLGQSVSTLSILLEIIQYRERNILNTLSQVGSVSNLLNSNMKFIIIWGQVLIINNGAAV